MNKERIIPQIQVRTHLRSGESGGWVGGVWYADKSGVCGTATVPPVTPQPLPQPIPPTNQTGGWIGGVWYPDRSGIC